MEFGREDRVDAAIARWHPTVIGPGPASFARRVVRGVAPSGISRARSLLWACGRLGAWAETVGLELRAEVVLHPSVTERFVATGMRDASESARRTARANLRFVARRVAPGLPHPPGPLGVPRSPPKAPYDPAEIAAFFALAAAQPTESRRQRLGGLLCLGLGAGLERAELRAVRGADVVWRHAGMVVIVAGRRARAVPVLARYQAALAASAAFAGDRFVCGGMSVDRKNLTAGLVARVAGGADVGRVDVGRLRSTWLAGHLEALGLTAVFAAAGITTSQRLGELARQLPVPDEATLIEVLGARR